MSEKQQHLFTITLHSNLFGSELDDEILEEMAEVFADSFYKSLEKRQLSDTFTSEIYWVRGSLVEHIQLLLQDPMLIATLGSTGTYKILQEYKVLRENAILIANDLKMVSTKVKGHYLSVKDAWVSDTKPPTRAKKLEYKQKKNNNAKSEKK